jgi:hypothetical protein
MTRAIHLDELTGEVAVGHVDLDGTRVERVFRLDERSGEIAFDRVYPDIIAVRVDFRGVALSFVLRDDAAEKLLAALLAAVGEMGKWRAPA